MLRYVAALKQLDADRLKKPVPWFRDGSFLLAMAAFLFSSITYFVSQRQARRQFVHDTRVELRNTLIQLDSFPARQADYPTKYSANTQSYLLKNDNAQIIILADQAYEFSLQIEDDLATSELFGVAQAIEGKQPHLAEVMLEKALTRPIETDTYIPMLRTLGQLQIFSGDPTDGDATFQKAEDASSKLPEYRYLSPGAVSSLNAMTEVSWCQGYTWVNKCPQAITHLNAAFTDLLHDSANRSLDEADVQSEATYVASMCGTLASKAAASPAQSTSKNLASVFVTVHFDSLGVTLPPTDKQSLDLVIAMMKLNPGLRLHINGYTDNVGSDEGCVERSYKYVASVVDYLNSHGISEDRLIRQGFGKTNPVAKNETSEGMAENRRVEVVPVSKDGT